MTRPTRDEIQRVRQHECRMRGHGWTPIIHFGDEDPTSFICDHCGRMLFVTAADPEENP